MGTWEIIPHADGVEVRLRGTIDRATLVAANNAAYAASPDDRAWFALFDLTEVTDFQVTGEQLRQLAHFDAAMAVRFRQLVTVIIGPAPELFGIARQWQLQADPVAAAVVRSRREAKRWLAERALRLEAE